MMESIPTTTLNLPRFGELTYAETDVIEFPWGLPGFASNKRWLLLNIETHSSFIWLQSIDDLDVAIPTADPRMVFEDYNPKLPPYAFLALAIERPDELATLCVVVVTPNATEMTMNLMAPIIVNLRTRKARQVMLENSAYSVREPIPRKNAAEAEEAAAP